jgi:hypothetical protein
MQKFETLKKNEMPCNPTDLVNVLYHDGWESEGLAEEFNWITEEIDGYQTFANVCGVAHHDYVIFEEQDHGA